MLARRIYLPHLSASNEFGPALHEFWRAIEAIRPGTRAIFDFSRCREIHAVGKVVISGARAVLVSRGASARIDLRTMGKALLSTFEASGCGAHLKISPAPTTSPLFRHDLGEDGGAVIRFLEEEWLTRAGFTLSKSLREELLGNVWEIYANAFEHGGSQAGVFTCGEKLDDGSMVLVVGDFGVGIPANATRALKRPVTGTEALKWAFTPGTTTLAGTQRHPRGLGLTLLKNLVELNDGRLDIQSHSGHTCVTSAEQSFRDISRGYAGTIVRLQLSDTGEHYMFKSELADYESKDVSPWN